MKLNLSKFISKNLKNIKNIKVKHIIIIILILFFLIIVTKQYYENFEECINHIEPALSLEQDTLPEICPYPSPSPQCSAFEEQVRRRREGLGSESREGVNVILELFYNDNCSITREFLYGCCKDFDEPIKNLFPSGSEYMIKNEAFSIHDNYGKNTGISRRLFNNEIYKNRYYR